MKYHALFVKFEKQQNLKLSSAGLKKLICVYVEKKQLSVITY